jgi:hypothetical protein
MFIWNISEISYRLINNSLSEQEKMKHYLILNILLVFTILFLVESFDSMHFIFLNMGIQILITSLGILLCYQSNKKGDNKYFIERMICLSLPIFFRIMILNALTTIPIVIFDYFSVADNDLYYIAKNGLLCILFYLWLNAYIVKIAQQSNDFQVPIQ